MEQEHKIIIEFPDEDTIHFRAIEVSLLQTAKAIGAMIQSTYVRLGGNKEEFASLMAQAVYTALERGELIERTD